MFEPWLVQLPVLLSLCFSHLLALERQLAPTLGSGRNRRRQHSPDRCAEDSDNCNENTGRH
ncbi:hypothetical protein AW168_39620 [Nocardia brasiliensis]|nr:hypothetical protein AW168_39620 [Nocardia brasiliensis]